VTIKNIMTVTPWGVKTSQPYLPVTHHYDGRMSLPTWVPEEETKPAPMPLLVVQSFVNTWEGDSDVDLLQDPVAGPRWLQEAGLAHGADVDLAQARAVRESIRALLVQNGGDGIAGADDTTALRALADTTDLRASVRGDGSVEVQPAQVGLGTLLLLIRDAQHDGTWARLKACRNPDCRWAYYDRSHAGRGAWCDMAVCGNRMKNRSLRSRRSARPGGRSAP
jgi:predicted RNA-binding Zn ribbon-like protein